MSGEPPSSSPPDMESHLTQDEHTALYEIKILLQPISVGKRKVSAALLSTPSTSTASSSASTSRSVSAGSVNFKRHEVNHEEPFYLPEVADSIEAIEFLGFSTETAQRIFTQFGKKHPDSDDTVLEFAQGWISQIVMPAFQGLSDDAIMNRVGFRQSFINAILAPDIPGMCESQILKDRINDTLYLRWLSMLQLQRKLKSAGIVALAKKRDSKRLRLDTTSSIAESSSQHPTITPPADYTTECLGATLSRISEHKLLETLLVVPEPDLLPGHTMLYKGKCSADLVEPPNLAFRDDGSLSMDRLWSWTGGDFNHNDLGHYWTPNRACAERYRADAADRAPFSESWLISIQVPDSFLQSLGIQEIWWGQNFRQFVWLNRRKQLADLPFPPALQKHQTANCVKGHVTYRDREILQLKKENVQSGFREQWLLVIDDRKQEQFCFKGNNVVLALSSQCRGKVHVEVHPPNIKMGR